MTQHEIRAVDAADTDSIVDVAVDSTLFAAEDGDFVRHMVAHYLDAGAADGQRMRVLELDGRIRGVVYYQPKVAAPGVWDLTMIAVPRDAHGNGHGTALMRHVEAELAAEGERLLVVETSATDQFVATRGFYRRLGYAEVARVADYWSDGDDLVLFRKDLRT